LFGVCISKPKTNKKQGKQKNNLLRLNQVVSSKFVFLFWGLAVIVILYILQAFRYTKITNRVYICLYYLYMCVCLICIHIYICVSWRTWYKRLWGGSLGGYIIYTLAANDFGLVEHTPQSKRHRSWPNHLLVTWFY
jgi:hypothetical protein